MLNFIVITIMLCNADSKQKIDPAKCKIGFVECVVDSKKNTDDAIKECMKEK